MKRLAKNKKALSPVVASVLLVLLVIVLAALIFLWARGFLTEKIEKFGQPIDQYCSKIDFIVEAVDARSSSKYELEVVNRGNVDIYQVDLLLKKGGNSELKNFEFSVGSGMSEKGEVDFRMDDGSLPDEVIAYPSLVGNLKGKDSNRVFTCIDNGRTLVL